MLSIYPYFLHVIQNEIPELSPRKNIALSKKEPHIPSYQPLSKYS